jgi:two-component system, chemotaxis family, chemotaxis protein CheY
MSPREPTLLVVDDDPAVLSTVSDILSDEGYQVVTASNGAEALETLDRTFPDLILLDMRMPVMDGWKFAQARSAEQRSIPLIVMTAAHDARKWALEIGAADYLAKPFDLLELLEVVERRLPER